MKIIKIVSLISLIGLFSACASTPVNYGDPKSKTPARGGAGGATAINASEYLKSCVRPVGTMSISEKDESAYYKHARRYGLQSPAQTLRLFAQQSNCFVVVERGVALESTEFERQLDSSGVLRSGSNFGKGQLVAADYTIQPSLVLQDNNAGGTKGGLLNSIGSVFVGVSGKVEYKDVQAVLTMIDNRSGVQVSIAEGSARGTDKEIFIGGLDNKLGAAFINSYARTHQQKVIVGAYLDAFNNLVSAVNNYVPQQSASPNGNGTGGSLKIN